MRVRPYLFYDVVVSICATCYRKVEGKIVPVPRRPPDPVRHLQLFHRGALEGSRLAALRRGEGAPAAATAGA